MRKKKKKRKKMTFFVKIANYRNSTENKVSEFKSNILNALTPTYIIFTICTAVKENFHSCENAK